MAFSEQIAIMQQLLATNSGTCPVGKKHLKVDTLNFKVATLN